MGTTDWSAFLYLGKTGSRDATDDYFRFMYSPSTLKWRVYYVRLKITLLLFCFLFDFKFLNNFFFLRLNREFAMVVLIETHGISKSFVSWRVNSICWINPPSFSYTPALKKSSKQMMSSQTKQKRGSPGA